jgi:hypothetical protein
MADMDLGKEIKRVKKDEEERRKELGAKIQALEEREKLLDARRKSLHDEVRANLRQEMEQAGLIEKGEEKKDEGA